MALPGVPRRDRPGGFAFGRAASRPERRARSALEASWRPSTSAWSTRSRPKPGPCTWPRASRTSAHGWPPRSATTPTKSSTSSSWTPGARPTASPSPSARHPRMGVFPVAPGPSTGLGWYRDWAEDLVTHEDVHLVHLLRDSRNGLWNSTLGLRGPGTAHGEEPQLGHRGLRHRARRPPHRASAVPTATCARPGSGSSPRTAACRATAASPARAAGGLAGTPT